MNPNMLSFPFLKHITPHAEMSSIHVLSLHGNSGTSIFSVLTETMSCTLHLLHMPLIWHNNFTPCNKQV